MIVVNARFLTQPITGVQRFAIEISKILKTLQDDIIFITPANILHHELATELNAIIAGKNTGTVWEQIDLRYYLLRCDKPLLVNFCNTGLLFYHQQIVTIHDMSYKVNPQWFSKKFYWWYNYLIPNLAKNSLRILTVSNSSKKDIINYLKTNSNKIKVVYNSSYLNTNNNFEQVDSVKYILTISSMDPRKNLKNLIKAFNKINEEIKLIIVGLKNSNFNITFNKEWFNNDKVILKGYVPDDELVQLIKNAQAFVYMSFYEGFGLPPVEAMSLNCPVIVSDIAAHKEICGEAALYANPYDADDIANKMISVLTDNKLRNNLIESGKKNIKRFDWVQSANIVLKNINEVA